MKMVTVYRMVFNPNKVLHPKDLKSQSYDIYGTVIEESKLHLEPKVDGSLNQYVREVD